ncbi:MAG: hypothetical protein ACTHU0_01305 [Kofleriaceae bacterium]
MATHSEILKAREYLRPRKVIDLKPEAFSDTWGPKPTAPLRVGFRLLSERDLQRAAATATRKADELYPDRGEESQVWLNAFYQSAISWVVANAGCHPDDVTAPPDGSWDEDNVPQRLTDAGILACFEAYEDLKREVSPTSPELDAEGATQLADILLRFDEFWGSLEPRDQRHVGRLLQESLDKLTGLVPII